jgi:hypothetical protein
MSSKSKDIFLKIKVIKFLLFVMIMYRNINFYERVNDEKQSNQNPIQTDNIFCVFEF